MAVRGAAAQRAPGKSSFADPSRQCLTRCSPDKPSKRLPGRTNATVTCGITSGWYHCNISSSSAAARTKVVRTSSPACGPSPTSEDGQGSFDDRVPSWSSDSSCWPQAGRFLLRMRFKMRRPALGMRFRPRGVSSFLPSPTVSVQFGFGMALGKHGAAGRAGVLTSAAIAARMCSGKVCHASTTRAKSASIRANSGKQGGTTGFSFAVTSNSGTVLRDTASGLRNRRLPVRVLRGAL